MEKKMKILMLFVVMLSTLNLYSLVTKRNVCGNAQYDPMFSSGHWVRLSHDRTNGQIDYHENKCYTWFTDYGTYQWANLETGCDGEELLVCFGSLHEDWSVITHYNYHDTCKGGATKIERIKNSPSCCDKRTWYYDEDGDGYHREEKYQCNDPGSNWKSYTKGTDCDDSDSRIYKKDRWFLDEDGDGYHSQEKYQCKDPGVNWSRYSKGYDCNDNNSAVTVGSKYCQDYDRDGYGANEISKHSCNSPYYYTKDCSDNRDQYNVMYYRNNGKGSIYNVSDKGKMGSKVYGSSNWTEDWSHIVPYNVEGKDYILFFKNFVSARVYKIDKEGSLDKRILDIDFEADLVDIPFADFPVTVGTTFDNSSLVNVNEDIEVISNDKNIGKIEWTHIKAYSTGDNNFILFYNSEGIAIIYKINKDGSLALGEKVLNSATWINDWSHIIPYNYDDDSFILFYRHDGLARIYKIAQDGTLGNRIMHSSNWTKNWSHIVNYTADGYNNYMMFYRNDGLAKIYNMNRNGLGNMRYESTSWVEDWSQIVHFKANSDHFMLFYRNDGLARIYELGPHYDGELGTRVFNTHEWEYWSKIISY